MKSNGLLSSFNATVLFACLSASTLFSSGATAEIYKWVDENGKVHFGDRPPNQGQAEDISESLKDMNISTDLSNPDMIRRAEQQRREERQKAYQDQQREVAQQKAYDEELKTWCRESKIRLANIQGRVSFYDEDGNDVYVTEQERKEMEKSLRAEINRTCK